MPVTLVGFSSQAAATTPLAPPSGVQVGDLLVAHTGADTTTTPSGWTRMVPTGSDWKSGYWRFAGSGDNSITSPETYTGMQMVAFRGVPSFTTTEYDDSKTVGTLTVPALTSTGTAGSLLVELYSTTYSGGNPNGHFALPNEIQLSPGFYAGYQLLANGETKPSFNINATSVGATYGTVTSVALFPINNLLPTAPTNVTLGTRVGNNIPVSWTHNDPDSNPQSKYKFRWRKVI